MSGTSSLGIAGIGLIGGSIALRARAVWPQCRIVGFEPEPRAAAHAHASRVVDDLAVSLAALAAEVHTLVLAVPVDAVVPALELLAGRPGPALIMDVASVKGPLVAAGRGVANYVGTHPMAGRERGGLAAAAADLFDAATWAYTPHADRAVICGVRDFIAAMGAQPIEIDPERHDAIVALTSHLPQALSVLLAAALAAAADDDPQVMDLCGPGMISMLRLARSPQQTWSPIVAANAIPLGRRLRSMAALLEQVAAALEAGESRALMSYFPSAHDVSSALEQRSGTSASSSGCRPPSYGDPAPPPAR